ncbi:hypothetical protein BH24DEI1_BH24DEI1_20090 [soil metagenome]
MAVSATDECLEHFEAIYLCHIQEESVERFKSFLRLEMAREPLLEGCIRIETGNQNVRDAVAETLFTTLFMRLAHSPEVRQVHQLFVETVHDHFLYQSAL